MIKEDPHAFRGTVDEVRVMLDRWASFYVTRQFTETVGDLAGYILQDNPRTINARLQGTIEHTTSYLGSQIIIIWR